MYFCNMDKIMDTLERIFYGCVLNKFHKFTSLLFWIAVIFIISVLIHGYKDLPY